jgi:CHAT domain-containing protein
LHAAGVYGGPQVHRARCSDYVVSSYTPTISALLRAQSKAPHTVPPHPAMLVVAESCRTHATMQTLWKVEEELKCVTAVARESKLGPSVDTIGSAATVAQVTDRVRSTHFVHLACHGIQHPTEALESGFYLSDGMLTVSKLMTLDLDRAWFAYLSACETAKGDASQPDQVVHLAAAMLFAGFKSVVATMW